MPRGPPDFWHEKHKQRKEREKQRKNIKDKQPKQQPDEEDQNPDPLEQTPTPTSTNNELDPIGQQIALLLIAALSFVVAFAINEALKDLQGTWFKGKPFARLVYVIGVILIAGIIIYYLGKYIEGNQ